MNKQEEAMNEDYKRKQEELLKNWEDMWNAIGPTQVFSALVELYLAVSKLYFDLFWSSKLYWCNSQLYYCTTQLYYCSVSSSRALLGTTQVFSAFQENY